MVTPIVQHIISGDTVHTFYNASGRIVTSYIGKKVLHLYLTSISINYFYPHFFILLLQISTALLSGVSLFYSFL